MTQYEYLYTDADNGRGMEVFRVVTLESRPGVAGIATTNKWVHVPADKVEEVCAALREAAGLPPVWTVEKVALDDDYDVTVREDGGVRDEGANKLTPTAAWLHAAQLLAAADEAAARAWRPKLPTTQDSVIKIGDRVWVRHLGSWYCPGLYGGADDGYMARQDFTVLHDPEKAS